MPEAELRPSKAEVRSLWELHPLGSPNQLSFSEQGESGSLFRVSAPWISFVLTRVGTAVPRPGLQDG